MKIQHKALALALLCSGCGSGIEVKRFDGTSATLHGVPYNLPMTAYTVSVTRYVTGCGPAMQGMVKATITRTTTLDSSAMFTLHSTGTFATSTIKATMAATGTNTGLNTTTVDKTGETITNVVSAIAAIAPLVAMAGSGRGAATEACKDDVNAAVTEIKSLTEQAKKDSDVVETATDNLNTETAIIKALGNTADKVARQRMASAIETLSHAKAALAADQKKLAEDTEKTSDTQVITWPDNGSQRTSGPYKLSLKKLKEDWGNVDRPEEQIPFFDVYLDLSPVGKSPIAPSATVTVESVNLTDGIPVRFPLPGRLSVCAGAPCGHPDSKNAGKDEGPVLQLGLVYSVPVAGGTFKSEVMNVALDANGAPTTVEVQENSAAAEGASSSIKSSATTIAAIPSAIVKARTDAATAEASYQTAKANAASAAELAPIQAETTLAKAKADQMAADDALDAAQKARNQSQVGN